MATKQTIHHKQAEEALRSHALSYPEAVEEFPWGHSAFKVKKKVFLFMGGTEDGGLSLSTKLTESGTAALGMPFAEPTGYGLGKSGWVSASFEPGQMPPVPILKAWIDESYRAIAPAKLLKSLAGKSNAPEAKRSTKKKTAASKSPRK